MRATSMRVVHIAPTGFGEHGLFGGGERFPLELARAMAYYVDTTLVTFGARRGELRDPSGLHLKLLPTLARWRNHPAQPFGPGLARAVHGADLVHVHQM